MDGREFVQGAPPNPLEDGQMDYMLRRKPKVDNPLSPDRFAPVRMENPGITNVSGVAQHPGPNIPEFSPTASPQSLYAPDPVSALDPAYSMHPIVRALSSEGGVSIPQYYPTAFMQSPLGKRNLSKSDLITALGLPGLGGQTQTQGVDQ